MRCPVVIRCDGNPGECTTKYYVHRQAPTTDRTTHELAVATAREACPRVLDVPAHNLALKALERLAETRPFTLSISVYG
jgi:hypothetical protein